MMKQTFLSSAKVNLILRVLSKRPDGYHNIVSLVDPVSLYDVIHIDELPEGRLEVTDDKGVLPKDEGNTMFRAAKLLMNAHGVRRGVQISVEKKIPIGAGLGGPSSNAATVLKALVGLWRIDISAGELNDLGRVIGADVPLFLHGKACIMEGIGEIITPVVIPRLWYVIVYPGVVMSTKEVYGKLRIVLTNRENDIKLMGNFKRIGDITGSLKNDLEQVGTVLCPKINRIKERLLEAGALGALMSGSGSSVFGIFRNEDDAREASRFFDDMGGVYVAHSL